MSPIPLGILAASGGVASAMELISTQSLSSAAATVTFSSIPQTYRHLQIRAVNKLDTSDLDIVNVSLMSINGNSTSFSHHIIFGDGSGVGSAGFNGFPYIYNLPTNNNGANTFAAQVIDILDYRSTTKNKPIRMLNGHASTFNRFTSLGGMAFLSTAAITSISFTGGSGYNWKAGSRFSLYGIKGE